MQGCFGTSVAPPASAIRDVIPELSRKVRVGLFDLPSACNAVEINDSLLSELFARIKHLEGLFESELASVRSFCRAQIQSSPQSRTGNEHPTTDSNGSVLERLQQLESDTRTDLTAVRAKLDEQFHVQIENASQHRQALEKQAQEWQGTCDKVIATLEKRVLDLHAKQAHAAEQTSAMEIFSGISQQKLITIEDKVRMLEKQRQSPDAHELQVFQQDIRSDILKCRASLQDMFALQLANFRKEIQDDLGAVRRSQDERRSIGSTETMSDMARQDFNNMLADMRATVHANFESFKANVEQKLEHIAAEAPAMASAFSKRVSDCESHGKLIAGDLKILEQTVGRAVTLQDRFSELEMSKSKFLTLVERLSKQVSMNASASEAQIDQLSTQSSMNAAALEKRLSKLERSEDSLTALEKRFSQLEALKGNATSLPERLRKLERFEEEFADVCQARSEQSVSHLRTEVAQVIEKTTQTLGHSISDLRCSAVASCKQVDGRFKEFETMFLATTKKLERHTEDLQSACERNVAMQRVVEEERAVVERLSKQLNSLEQHLGTLAQTGQEQLRRTAKDLRMEAQDKITALEGKLSLSIQVLQDGAENIKKARDRAAFDQQEFENAISRKVQAVIDESENIGVRIGNLEQVDRNISSEVERGQVRLQKLELHVETVMEDHEQSLKRNVRDLRTDIAAGADASLRSCQDALAQREANGSGMLQQLGHTVSELRSAFDGVVDDVRKHSDRTADVERASKELHSSLAAANMQIERALEVSAASDEHNRVTGRMAEEASRVARDAEAQVARLGAQIEAESETRSQVAERAVAGAATEAKLHADHIVRKVSHNLEELRSTVIAIERKSRTLADNANDIDGRISTASKTAQQQLGHTAEDLRREAKHNIEVIGNHVQTTNAELRCLVSALALQIGCTVTGNAIVAGHGAPRAAHLEQLQALDSHRIQLQREQAQLEERLLAALQSQKVAFDAELEHTTLRAAEHHRADIAKMNSDFANMSAEYNSLKANILSLELQLMGRVGEWDCMHERMNSLQSAILENRNSVQFAIVESRQYSRAIASAVSTISCDHS